MNLIWAFVIGLVVGWTLNTLSQLAKVEGGLKAPTPSNSPRKWTCAYCNRDFVSLNELDGHLLGCADRDNHK